MKKTDLPQDRTHRQTGTDLMKFASVFVACSVLWLIGSASSAQAQPAWALTTADFQTRQVDLMGIDDAGAKVADKAGAAPRTVPWEQLLDLERSAPPRGGGKFVLRLVHGDQLRGEPVKIEGENLKWSSPLLGEIVFPLRRIASIERSGHPAPSRGAGGDKPAEDVVRLANGDAVSGIISDIGAGGASIQANGNPVTVPLDSVSAIVLAVTGPATAPAAPGRAIRIKLIDDSLFSARDVRMSGGELQLTLSDRTQRPISMDVVVGIEQVNGPVSWLSSRPPSENVQTPFLETARPARMDHSVSGGAIRFAERSYSRGIGVEPYSRITWALDGTYQTFRTQYAIDGDRAYANVAVRILLDGKPVHERKDFAAGELSPVVQVPLGNAKSITLEVNYGANYGVQDHFNWIEPALVKSAK
jgi:hypothetical protein